MGLLIYLTTILSLLPTLPSALAMQEVDRLKEYDARGHQWPPLDEEFQPNTPAYRKLFDRRFSQLQHMDDPNSRYNGYMTTIHAALTCKNFTEHGWGLTRAPQHIIDLLQESLRDGLVAQELNPTYEKTTKAIDGDLPPFFIQQPDLNEKVLLELLPLHEAWAGVPLVPNNSYGMRVYRDGANLNMHLDKVTTHIISSILHVGHDDDMESWPLVIEDFNGNTNEVHLEAGDMLFYESSKCLHGRPRKMNGGWYSSVFTHYYPVDWDAYTVKMDQHYRIPPVWNDYKPRETGDVELLKGADSSVMEPGCENEWCALKDTVPWYGPGPGYGKVMSAGGVVTELENIPSEESFYPDYTAPEEYATPDPNPNLTPRPTPDKTCTDDALVS
eukprot:CAMPEP_0198254866 /NCGR_PEP_ID=MMETSP1447-20131203/5115_1 /TAXON_ID=420782 /ORGANISM="Chaetoceros dichaeta, Strain CCMP1751" /LENGTH=385 /DNA_ID=CAMNT_0043941089 /DNA_START=40 /DNA_END=1197 /DNA_ORIENTATION=-